MNTKKVRAKRQPSKNARTHGLYASEVVLPEESQKEFDDLLESFRNEYCPDGISENEAVDELAILQLEKTPTGNGSAAGPPTAELCPSQHQR